MSNVTDYSSAKVLPVKRLKSVGTRAYRQPFTLFIRNPSKFLNRQGKVHILKIKFSRGIEYCK